jgi:preprotein translocase subunit SecG
MSMDRLEVRVSLTKLLLALLIIIVPLSIIGLVLTQRSDKALDNAVGSNFKTMAQLYAGQVTQFIRERITDVMGLANDSTIVNAVSNNTGKKSPQVALDSSASQILRLHKSLDPRFLSIVATNADGTVVASSSQRPAQTSYAQDAQWQAVYNNGQGATKISAIVDDPFTKSYYANIGVPVTDQTGKTVGVINAAVNLTDVLAPFRQDQIGNGAKVALVNDDGNIVSAPNADVFARIKSQEFDYVHDALGTNQGSQSGWVAATLARGPYIVGYASTGLKQTFPNMGWVVTVTQEEHQAAAPIRQLERFALAMVILALFMLTLLCVYYYLHRTQKFTHMEEEESSADQVRSTTASARL